MIKMKSQNDRYEVVCSLTDAQTVRASKFEYDFDARVFYTYLPERAAKLAEYAIDDHTAQCVESAKFQMQRNYRRSYALKGEGILDIPVPEGLKLKPFQQAGIETMVERGNALLADDQGIGKTIQIIGLINVLRPESVLIICPATIKYQWKAFIEQWCVHPYTIQVLKGQKKQKITGDIVIVNYDILMHQKRLFKQKWDMKVADECDYLITEDAQRTKAFVRIPAKRVYCLSGTPGDVPIDQWVVLKELAPQIFGNWDEYTDLYCDKKRYIQGVSRKHKRGWDIGGASNLDELNLRMRATVMIRREKKDVLPQLPKVMKEIVPLDIEQDTGGKIARFLELERQLVSEHILKRTVISDADYEEAVRLLVEGDTLDLEATCFASYRKELGILKIELIKAYINLNLKHYRKIVVVTYHREVTKALMEHYKDISIGIMGGTPVNKRQQHIKQFQTDDSIRLFFGQIRSIARGVDGLQHVCYRMILTEIDWSLRNMIQVIDRLCRMGQKEQSLASYLVLNNTLEVRIAKRCLEKEGIYRKMYK